MSSHSGASTLAGGVLGMTRESFTTTTDAASFVERSCLLAQLSRALLP